MTSFSSAIVNAAILSALLSVVVWCALRITPRRALNAASRYAIWWIVLAVSLALPLAHVGVKVAIRMPKVPAVPPRFTEVSRQFEWEMPVVEAPPAVARGFVLPLEISASPWLRALSFFWIAGSALLLVRVFVSYAALYRRSARATVRDERVAGGRQIRVGVSTEIGIPIATGPFRPSILIPARLFEQIGAADLDQIISHERAHLARRDDYSLFIQRVIEALFALHPVVRWVTRQIDLEREVACDDIVVGATQNARSYADCLTRMVALCGGVRPSLAATSVADSRSHLSRRIELLVDTRRTMHTQVLAGRLAIIAIALVCAAEVLAKTPLLVAFATPQAAIPQSVIPQTTAPSRAFARHDAQAPAMQRPVTGDSVLLQDEYWLYSQAKRPEQLAASPPVLLVQTASTQPETPASPSGLPLYVLGAHDVLAVTLFDNKVIPGTYAIGADGVLSVPLIGSFKASGLTIPELTVLIEDKLRDSGISSEPLVNVQLLLLGTKRPRQMVARRPVLITQVAQTQPEMPTSPSASRPRIPLYLLGAHDVVAVSVFDEKAISGTYAIGADGDVSVPLIGSFKASGLTIPQLTFLLRQKLRENAGISDPIVNVQLLRNNSKQYTLLGAVSRPGPVPLLQETTILDALVASGGFKGFAKPEKIVVKRGDTEYHFNYREVVKGQNMDQNIILADGDTIFVPE